MVHESLQATSSQSYSFLEALEVGREVGGRFGRA